MDGNKDEALKCLEIGKNALGLGDRIRALKFIKKAHKLDPSLSVTDLLSNLENSKSSETNVGSGNAAGKFPGDSSGVRRRIPKPRSGSISKHEQMIIVNEINKKINHYDILGLSKSSSVEDVIKSYRKLSLKVHPDKNNAPGSEEAFKKLSNAFRCLSDVETRKEYDDVLSANRNEFYRDENVDAEEIFRDFSDNFGARMGTKTGRNNSYNKTGYERQSSSRHRANQGFRHEFYRDENVDAEEIFSDSSDNFGARMGTKTGSNSWSDEADYERQFSNRHRANQRFGNGFYYDKNVDDLEIFTKFFYKAVNNFGPGMDTRTSTKCNNTVLKLIPVILILILSVIFLPNDPVYSFSRSNSYNHSLFTEKGVSFFVKSRNFEQNYPLNSPERMQLEGRIEHEYISIVSHNCRLETGPLHWGYQVQTPNCDMLRKFDALVS